MLGSESGSRGPDSSLEAALALSALADSYGCCAQCRALQAGAKRTYDTKEDGSRLPAPLDAGSVSQAACLLTTDSSGPHRNSYLVTSDVMRSSCCTRK
mmetsp:Transcript_53062/g.114766  ORF Transcript_53062/g.114766 Transcript_53062/m.114766 type:complete len:98 (+) Transcript_53062:99-392(+)